MRIFRSFPFTAMLLAASVMTAQDTLPGLMFNAKAALIFTSRYANISSKTEYPDENSVIERTEMPGANRFSFGFELGADMYFLRSESFKLVLGLTYARTTAAHHYSYISEDPSTKPGFTHVRHSSQKNIEEVYNALNISGGARFKAYRHFFLLPELVISRPMKIKAVTNGYDETTFVNRNTNESQTTIFYTDNAESVNKNGETNVSLRITAQYEFILVDLPVRAYLYRNLGFVFTMPWWGAGLSVTLN
jgi:hypothetical protein